VINTVKADHYTSALNLLQNDLIKKTDGCALSAHQPDKDDWIVTCEAPGKVYPELMYIVEEITALQTP
jgi:hypothetical protein